MSKCECEHITHFDSTFATTDGSPDHRYGAHFEIDDVRPVKTIWGTFVVCTECDTKCYGSQAQGLLIKENEVKSGGSQGD